MAQVINGIPLNPSEGMDKVTWTDKITKGYFTGDVGKLEAGNIHSASLTDSNEAYYYGIAKDNTTGSVQFDVAYGNVNGYGSDTDAGAITGKTKAIYKQWANILLNPTEVTGGLKISRNSGLSSAPSSATVAAGEDESIYVLVGQRALFKDRLNKKNWTIVLSGSMSGNNNAAAYTGSNPLVLTDDSANIDAISTIAGPRYNIVSGSQGTVVNAASVRTYGWVYPDQGVMVFSGAELSASIPAAYASASTPAVYNQGAVTNGQVNTMAFNGFGDTSNVDQDYNNALRFVNCLLPAGAYMQFRSEEDQTSVSYFCRAKAGQLNFSNSATFRSGSLNEIRNKTMKGNPTVYITGVELYDGGGNLVANGKLSTPLKKNFSSEATIKTKLTF